jgi:hypothetical protein
LAVNRRMIPNSCIILRSRLLNVFRLPGVRSQMVPERRHIQRLGILIYGAAIVAGFLFFFCELYPEWRTSERLAHDGISTIGVVTAKEPRNHQTVRYRYSLGGTSYTGATRVGRGGLAPFEKINVGDQITVTYWPEHPVISTGGDGRDLYASQSTLLFIILPLVFVFAAGMVLARAVFWQGGPGPRTWAA